MLIIVGGLPGVGKTTLMCQLAEMIHAVYLRIDTIEVTIKQSFSNITDIGSCEYQVI